MVAHLELQIHLWWRILSCSPMQFLEFELVLEKDYCEGITYLR